MSLNRFSLQNPKQKFFSNVFCYKQSKKGSGSVEDFVLKIKNTADELMAAGQYISDDELILYILGELGPEFESVVVNLTT